ncbi:MAG: CBS domain-containing protein [Verrucomicrobia bacterium]|nr:CBS domain-containing protein [Verrucomicrobiota bacterium]
MTPKMNAKRHVPGYVAACCVDTTCTLRNALRVMSEGAVGIVLMTDRSGHLQGTITDGDIRRALLKGVGLDDAIISYIQRSFVSVPPSAGRAEVLEMMQAMRLDQIPIVDAKGRLTGLHTLHAILGNEKRPNTAVIMAGGQGTRLRPVTEHIPKPMIRVAGRPILERLVLHLVGSGITRICLAVHYLAHVIEDHFGDGSRFGCRIDYLHEKEPRGTGGALALVKPRPRHPLIVMNGDLITQADIPAMLRFHEAGGFEATMAVRRYGHQVPFGCVEVKRGRVTRLEEKPVLERSINAGIYVLNPALLRRIPDRFYPITELFDACLKKGGKVGAFEVEEEWIDIGQRDQLKAGKAT